jgi:hypothetical protein
VIVAGSAAAAADLDFEAGHSIEVSWRRYHQRSCRKSAAPTEGASQLAVGPQCDFHGEPNGSPARSDGLAFRADLVTRE